MEPDRPGWYRDPRRPGLRRYWDGDAWVDVDQVVDGHHDPSPVTSAPVLFAQRRSTDEPARTTEPVDEVADAESRPPVEPGPLPD